MTYFEVLAMRDAAHETSNAKRFFTLLDVPIGAEGELAAADGDPEAQRAEELAGLVELKEDGLAEFGLSLTNSQTSNSSMRTTANRPLGCQMA